MTSIEEIEENIKHLLLTDVNFILEGKKLKTGKLILFAVRDFFCIFTLFDNIKNKKTIYEIPYPFSFRTNSHGVEFDYTVDAFCEKCTGIHDKVKTIPPKKTSKFFNKKLIVSSQSYINISSV